MQYTTPNIVDYGDVGQITAAQSLLNILDAAALPLQTAGLLNTTGPCKTGQEEVGGICTPLPGL